MGEDVDLGFADFEGKGDIIEEELDPTHGETILQGDVEGWRGGQNGGINTGICSERREGID